MYLHSSTHEIVHMLSIICAKSEQDIMLRFVTITVVDFRVFTKGTGTQQNQIKMAVRTVFNRRAQNLVYNTKYGKTDHVILACSTGNPTEKYLTISSLLRLGEVTNKTKENKTKFKNKCQSISDDMPVL